MNFEAGIRFIFFLVLFGVTNYLGMLRRYEFEIKKKGFFYKIKKFPIYILKLHLIYRIKSFYGEIFSPFFISFLPTFI